MMRILLIDDEISFIDNLILYLEGDGHAVDSLSWVRTEEDLRGHLARFQPEGVILDFGMVPQGDVLYEWIYSWSPVPIVFYTSYARNPDKKQLMEAAGRRLHPRSVPIVLKQEVGSDVETLLRALQR
jgi:DNA-binding response OmpR family regulator